MYVTSSTFEGISYRDKNGVRHIVYGNLYAMQHRQTSPPPQVHKDKTKYCRKQKHKNNYSDLTEIDTI